jgi:hypothetical protein
MLLMLKRSSRLFLVVALFLFGRNGMADENIVVEKQEEDGVIEFINQTNEPDILGVGASNENGDRYWSVFVNVAEFVREEPLESEFRNVVANALSSVKGVTSVEEEDREVWLVEGDAQGPELVAATVKALHTIYPKLSAYMQSF